MENYQKAIGRKLISGINIRSVSPSDKLELAEIQLSNWSAGTWWGDGYYERLELAFQVEPEGLFLAEIAGKPVGWSWAAAIGPNGLREVGTIILVSVRRSDWGQGIGFILFKEAECYLASRGCAAIEFETHKRRARVLSRLGYEVVGQKSPSEDRFIKYLRE